MRWCITRSQRRIIHCTAALFYVAMTLITYGLQYSSWWSRFLKLVKFSGPNVQEGEFCSLYSELKCRWLLKRQQNGRATRLDCLLPQCWRELSCPCRIRPMRVHSWQRTGKSTTFIWRLYLFFRHLPKTFIQISAEQIQSIGCGARRGNSGEPPVIRMWVSHRYRSFINRFINNLNWY